MQPWWRWVAISYAIIMNFGNRRVQNWNNSVWGWLLNIYSCRITSTGSRWDKRMHVIYLFHKLSTALKHSCYLNFISRRKETRRCYITSIYLNHKSLWKEICWGFYFLLLNLHMKTEVLAIFIYTLLKFRISCQKCWSLKF